MSVFQNLAEEFIDKFGRDLFKSSANFISDISPLFAAGFGIYICIIALDAYNRGLDENAVDLSKRMFGWLIIIAAAFNASQYSAIAEWIYGLPDAAAASFGTKVDVKIFDNASLKIEQIGVMFDTARNELGSGLKDLASSLFLSAVELVVKLIAYLFLGVVFAYYCVSRILLSLNLVIGPLFIGSMLFPTTRQYGMNWIGQSLNNVLTIVLISILAGWQVDYFIKKLDENLNLLSSSSAVEITVAAMGLISLFVAITAVFVLAIWKTPAMVSALTGGASLEGFGGNLGRMMGGTRTAQAINKLPTSVGKAVGAAVAKVFNKGGNITPK